METPHGHQKKYVQVLSLLAPIVLAEGKVTVFKILIWVGLRIDIIVSTDGEKRELNSYQVVTTVKGKSSTI